ncbi:MAG: hypothetical protein NC937_05210, partial [Candidatus Omnitrophica bacterium]|nr:hypothetical protein [Candidatus Omnitrophota bacterium]
SLPKPIVPYLPFETRPPDPAGPGWIEFQMRGQPRYRIDGGSWNTPLPAGVSYTSDGTTTETFTFTSYTPPGNRKIYVRASSGRSGGACFDGTSSTVYVVNSVLADGNIVFKGSINLSQNALFEADVNGDGVGTMIIHPNTTFSNSDLIVYDYNGNKTFTINHSNITINGALITNTSLKINAPNLTIDASSSAKPAAIVLYTPSTATFILDSTPSITLGSNQNYAFLLLSQNQPIKVHIASSGNVDFISNPITGLGDKATIVAYSTGSSATIDIGSTSYYARIPGLVYSYGASEEKSEENITLNNANTFINGCLVANGTVKLNNGTLTYDKNALDIDRIRIYSGFTGGRRIYLPVNWKIQW